MDMIEADAAHGVSTGAGAVVAVVDSGVLDTRPDLGARLLPGHDSVDDDESPQGGNGHSTHVAGIVAANTGKGVAVSSVAPGAKVLPVRVLGDDGSCTSEDVVAGIDWAAANGADVINLSLARTCPCSAPGVRGGHRPRARQGPDRGGRVGQRRAAGL